jgi:hypothetical protein
MLNIDIHGQVLEIPTEFNDIEDVLIEGARKYGANSWLEGHHFNERDNFASINRHISKSLAGIELDEDSGLDHRLHAACRLLMAYTLEKRGKK